MYSTAAPNTPITSNTRYKGPVNDSNVPNCFVSDGTVTCIVNLTTVVMGLILDLLCNPDLVLPSSFRFVVVPDLRRAQFGCSYAPAR